MLYVLLLCDGVNLMAASVQLNVALREPERIRKEYSIFVFLLGMLLWLPVLDLQCGKLIPLNI